MRRSTGKATLRAQHPDYSYLLGRASCVGGRRNKASQAVSGERTVVVVVVVAAAVVAVAVVVVAMVAVVAVALWSETSIMTVSDVGHDLAGA